MRARAQYAVQHLAKEPRGWHVRSKREGSHILRIAFPPGRRKRGSGKVLEILHPKKNPECACGKCALARKNPSELLIFGNPSKRNAGHISPADLKELSALYGRAPDTAVSNADKVNWAANEFNKRHPGTRATARRALGATNPASHAGGNRKIQSLQRQLKTVKRQIEKVHPGKDPRWKSKIDRLTAKGGKIQEQLDRARTGNFRRRNPSDEEQAVKLFESFHGKDAQEVIEAQRSAAMRLDYTALGPLVALGFEDGGFAPNRLKDKWDQCNHIDFDGDGVMLASAPNGKQLYFIGGNQNLDGSLSSFPGVDAGKDLIDLGDVYFVVYEARKVHDAFEPADYCHRFGEGKKTLPRLAYDKLKKEMLLFGGEYFISTKEGISPGIEG